MRGGRDRVVPANLLPDQERYHFKVENANASPLRRQLEEWSATYDALWQNRLLTESEFISFSKDRGLPVFGAVDGEPGEFQKLGWLRADGHQELEDYLFHPFRIYPLHMILDCCDLRIARSATLDKDSVLRLVEHTLNTRPPARKIAELAEVWNETADLAVILEPLYWPQIVSRFSLRDGLHENEYRDRLKEYSEIALELVRSLTPDVWAARHEAIRLAAAWMDDNSELYILLRLSGWQRREQLKGVVSGALWLRHMAEVIRRGFEEVHATQWLEEDRGFGHWPRGSRTRLFGSERPFDDEFQAKPYLAYAFGLFTGSEVRWYVEGDTEFYATKELITDTARFAIELVNLKGSIKTGKGNIALNLQEGLQQDRQLKRFSVISFDLDVPENCKMVRQQVKLGNVVGSIAAHRPDFEFANFTLPELVEVAARIDANDGHSGDATRQADWNGIKNAHDFSDRYLQVSQRKQDLKGERWGRALAAYARENPKRSDTGEGRPLIREISGALQAWASNYDADVEYFEFDPDTFEKRRRSPNPKT